VNPPRELFAVLIVLVSFHMFTLPTNRSTSRTNASSAADAPRALFASDVALFIVPATTVLFAPVTTGDGAGASVVIVGIIDATPNANANIALVTASFSRFALCSARLAAAAPASPSLELELSPRRKRATRSSPDALALDASSSRSPSAPSARTTRRSRDAFPRRRPFGAPWAFS